MDSIPCSSEPEINVLFIFGLGYTAEYLIQHVVASTASDPTSKWLFRGTSRGSDAARLQRLRELGVLVHLWDFANGPLPTFAESLAAPADSNIFFLNTIPPGEAAIEADWPSGDLVLRHHVADIKSLPNVKWFGLLSTTGLYGDRKGEWVDETTEPMPGNARTKRRLDAEQGWSSALGSDFSFFIFRLPSIYGPGESRNSIAQVKSGRAHRVVKENQFFSRIHVKDLASALYSSMQLSSASSPSEPSSRIFCISDDEPTPPHDVVTYACGLLGVEPPPLLTLDEAIEQRVLSPMAVSFYSESRKVSNAKAKRILNWTPKFPTYREGLKDVFEAIGKQ